METADALGIQRCGHGWEGGLPEKAALPLVTRVSLGGTRVVGGGFPRVLGTSARAVSGSGAQAVLVAS